MLGRDFAWALNVLKSGGKVQRQGWNGKGMYLALQEPDNYSKMRRPYLYMRPVGGDLVPWVASQSDLLESDWVAANEPITASVPCSAQSEKNTGDDEYRR